MRTTTRLTLPLIVLAVLLAPAVGVGAISRATAGPALVKAATAQVLVNAQGMTLYVFAVDKPHKSACYGKCAAFWPPALAPKGTTVPTTMPGLSGTFGVALRTDGTRQLTYDGAPLYTWIKDKKPGDMTGQGVGGTWWAVAASRPSSTSKPGY